MAERRVLHPRFVLPGDVRRALHLGHDRAQTSEQDHKSQDADARQRISTAVEDLCHSDVLNPWHPMRIPVQQLDDPTLIRRANINGRTKQWIITAWLQELATGKL